MKALVLVGCLGLICSACAHGGADSAAYSLAEVDKRPQFIGCSGYEPPNHEGPTYRVELQFDVSAEGEVINPMASGDHSARRIGAVSRAQTMASSCRYWPAEIDGRTVAVKDVSRYFLFSP